MQLSMVRKSFKILLLEIVLIAILVGFVPELVVGSLNDAFGACGFDNETCGKIKLQSVYKTIAAMICAVCAVVVSFLVSKEFNAGEENG